MAKDQVVNSKQGGAIPKKPRSSNLELYRIVCMLMIVAHHFVVNSGVAAAGGPILEKPQSGNSLFLLLWGAWGKTGINCFLMITGYFMCKSRITVQKFLKLFLQIFFYSIVIYVIFLIAGYEKLSPVRILSLFPVWDIDKGFSSCFVVFYLTIPFWNILVQHMRKQQHEWLLIVLLVCYSLLGSIPTFQLSFNYVTWFGVIYLIASYIRLYPKPLFERKSLWGWLTMTIILMAMGSVVAMQYMFGKTSFYFVSDCNKLLAVAVAVSSFLWFKNMNIKYSKTINAFGAATFGVLLIHANSNAMRTWLWRDTLDVIGHYDMPLGQLMLFSIGVVLVIFVICNLIDQLRIASLEKWFFCWYDKKLSAKVDALIDKITSVRNEQ